MRFLTISALTTLLPFALAQNLPDCAQSCLTGSASLPSSCSQSDIGCICKDNNFISAVSCCVAQQCSGSDIQAAISFATSLCESAGVTVATTLPPTCAAATGTASSTPAGGVTTTSAPAAGSTGTGSAGGNGTGSGNSTLSGTATLTATATASGIASTAGAATMGAEAWRMEAAFVGAVGALAAFAL